MLKFFRQFYLSNRFFLLWLGVIVLFCLSFPFAYLFPVAQLALVGLLAVTFLDVFILFFNKAKIKAERTVNTPLSLGDVNNVELLIESNYTIPIRLKVIDEIPYQFQIRDFEKSISLGGGESKLLSYTLRPTKRGMYLFQSINLFVATVFGLVQRRVQVEASQEVAVYPSILQMKKYELQLFSQTAVFQGIKKVRRLGNNNEFEQIKNYVQGDDLRTINWKATSRRGELMVNQYQDERAQQVYCVVDKSRSMRMPFEGLSLLDHAINASLVLSNIILKKGDKAGVITFSDKLGSRVTAEGTGIQLRRIMEVLYKQKTRYLESNYESLYYGTRNIIKGRSLILLFTNFESHYALERNLTLLRKMSQQHLLVVIFFENTEIVDVANQQSKNVKDIYVKTMAGKFALEKKKMIQELNRHGIQSILTKPEDLTVNTINKYLEIKSRGML
ncbi:MAG: DUF58 domain-containing protein [Flavobacteriales bacterium]|jgi:uncharacterized protein (DUF58 family)|nr:DUF58 domain-containing protein [Flavobacteriales bacterium]